MIQIRAVPFILLDYAQPNFLTAKGGGNRALRKVYAASLGPEFEAYRPPSTAPSTASASAASPAGSASPSP